MEGHTKCVRLLLDAGADKEATTDVRGEASFGLGNLPAVFFLMFSGIHILSCLVGRCCLSTADCGLRIRILLEITY
jgi:hypothetical protein